MDFSLRGAAKFWVAMAGAACTSLLAILPPDTQGWQIVTVVSAVTTAALVWGIPNEE